MVPVDNPGKQAIHLVQDSHNPTVFQAKNVLFGEPIRTFSSLSEFSPSKNAMFSAICYEKRVAHSMATR